MDGENRILILSENEEVCRQLAEQLMVEGNYMVESRLDSAGVLAAFREQPFDVVFTSPSPERPDTVNELRSMNPDCVIIALLEHIDTPAMEFIDRIKAFDFISRPFNSERVFFIAKKALEQRLLLSGNRRACTILKEQNAALQKQNIMLARRIEESTRNLARLYEDLRSTYLRTIRALAQAIDARDHYTHSHSENVAEYSLSIAKALGLSIKEMETLREAAQLHDLGKIGVSDLILLKPGPLTPPEWEIIKKHPEQGAQILEPLTFLGDVIELVRQHHEHYNGSGYPAGLKDSNILLGARILHVADAYDSMVSARSYRTVPLTREEAVQELVRHSGTQFDPQVVSSFVKSLGGV